jgi:hypothetical protein
MAKKSSKNPTEQNNCIEGEVYFEGDGFLKYSLSNSLDEIKAAIYTRTGHNIDLEKAIWTLNTGLSIDVKNLMLSHNVKYSMTT